MAPEMNMMSQNPFPGQQIHRLFQLYPYVHMDVPCSDPKKNSVMGYGTSGGSGLLVMSRARRRNEEVFHHINFLWPI